ncbi:putative oligosaccharyl transferase complex, subunit OST3/OST6, Thioredoxin-like superfamily [Dioscorea sansibarensis]
MILRTLVLSLLLLLPISSASSDADLVAELVALRARSPSGVIHFDDRAISRFLTSAPSPRPFSLLVFFDAAQLRDKPELHLPQLRSEFGLLSSSFFLHNPSSTSLFFCDIEFQESQSSFQLFGVSSLPHIRLVSPHHSSPKDSDAMDPSDFSRLAESMAEFVQARTGLEVGPIKRPPPLSTKQILLLIAALIASAPFVIKRVLVGDTILHDRKLWMSLAVFVYFFSVSGTMHNIIRKMPMFMTDRADPGKLVFFYQGSGMQLGAEGFAIGFLYTAVGVALAATTHGLVRLKNVKAQRGYMLVAMLVAYWAVSKVIYLDNWKTGYSIHAYWPTSWR